MIKPCNRSQNRFAIGATLAALITILNFQACRSRGEPIATTRENTPRTEFHHKPARWIPWFYTNKSTRGLDRASDANFMSQVGGGFGLLLNSSIDPQWNGHKFFYYYIDFDISPQRIPEGAYPGSKQWTYSSYPGIMFRTYTPFFLKLHYGLGVNLRYNQQVYDRWGLYGQMGLELWGITTTAIFIGHPGQANWETEYRLGYMWAPVEWR